MTGGPEKPQIIEPTTAFSRPYATRVLFIGKASEQPFSQIPTSVEIFARNNKWYCRVRRGNEETRPIGPYTKQQAERIQDTRRSLLGKKGTARLIFEPVRTDAHAAAGPYRP